GGVHVLARCGEHDLARAGVEVLRQRFTGGEDARRVEDDVRSGASPGKLRRVTLRRDGDRAGTDTERVVAGRDRAAVRAVGRVELEQIGQRVERGEVVDVDDLDVFSLRRDPQELPTDPPEPVDPYSHVHL